MLTPAALAPAARAPHDGNKVLIGHAWAHGEPGAAPRAGSADGASGVPGLQLVLVEAVATNIPLDEQLTGTHAASSPALSMGNRNNLACSRCQPATASQAAQLCSEHQHRAHLPQVQDFPYTGQSIDWRTLHGVYYETLVSWFVAE